MTPYVIILPKIELTKRNNLDNFQPSFTDELIELSHSTNSSIPEYINFNLVKVMESIPIDATQTSESINSYLKNYLLLFYLNPKKIPKVLNNNYPGFQNLAEKKRFCDLKNEFEIEFQQNSIYLIGSSSQALIDFEIIAKELAKIVFVDSTTELSITNSFKIKLLLSNKILLVITKPLGLISDLKNSEVIFSIFENKKCLISDAIEISQLVKGINAYLASK